MQMDSRKVEQIWLARGRGSVSTVRSCQVILVDSCLLRSGDLVFDFEDSSWKRRTLRGRTFQLMSVFEFT